jgi:AbrB family looped-hinge helix DNA binding protein
MSVRKKNGGFSDAFYGTATIGERGQIVIPADARLDMDMSPGEKVLIMKHPVHAGIMLFKIEAAKEFVDDFQSNLKRLSEES